MWVFQFVSHVKCLLASQSLNRIPVYYCVEKLIVTMQRKVWFNHGVIICMNISCKQLDLIIYYLLHISQEMLDHFSSIYRAVFSLIFCYESRVSLSNLWSSGFLFLFKQFASRWLTVMEYLMYDQLLLCFPPKCVCNVLRMFVLESRWSHLLCQTICTHHFLATFFFCFLGYRIWVSG